MGNYRNSQENCQTIPTNGRESSSSMQWLDHSPSGTIKKSYRPELGTLWPNWSNPIDQTRPTNRVYIQTCERPSTLGDTYGTDSASKYECGDGFSCKKYNWQGKIGPTCYHMLGEPWCCYIEGQWLMRQVAGHLREHINCITIEEHWDKKVCYKSGHKSMIDHKMANWAIQSSPKSQQRWASKTVAQFLPYGTNMKQWQMRTEDKCPRCQQLVEGKDHITQCQAEEANECWETSLQQLDDWLQTQQTEAGIRHKLISGLQWWNKGLSSTQMEEEQSPTAKEQEVVGWDLMLEGCISKIWREQQQQHLKAYKSRNQANDGLDWAIKETYGDSMGHVAAL